MEQLLTALKELDRREFFIQMADHLSMEDYDLLHEIHNKKQEIIKQLKNDYGIDYTEERG